MVAFTLASTRRLDTSSLPEDAARLGRLAVGVPAEVPSDITMNGLSLRSNRTVAEPDRLDAQRAPGPRSKGRLRSAFQETHGRCESPRTSCVRECHLDQVPQRTASVRLRGNNCAARPQQIHGLLWPSQGVGRRESEGTPGLRRQRGRFHDAVPLLLIGTRLTVHYSRRAVDGVREPTRSLPSPRAASECIFGIVI